MCTAAGEFLFIARHASPEALQLLMGAREAIVHAVAQYADLSNGYTTHRLRCEISQPEPVRPH